MMIVKLQKITASAIVRILQDGGLVILPTETLYGAMVDATNQLAVKKLTAYKNRPFGKPYSIAVTSEKMAEKYVFLNKTAQNLYKTFLPGPLTIISKGKHKVALGVEAEDGTLGIRIPDYKLVLDVVNKLAKPVTATSANASYKKRPYKISDLLDNLSDKQKNLIDLIVDAGTLPSRDPSTVIDTTLDDLVVLRQGEIKLSNKEEILSKSEEATQNLAKELWQKYEPNHKRRAIVFALEGEMGSGKTIFTKGLALGMGITELITSPSYALENEYETRNKKLYHFDTWRMTESKEFVDLGFENLIKGKEVISIEWAEKVQDVIREFDDEAIIIWVKINYPSAGSGQANENDRVISWGTI